MLEGKLVNFVSADHDAMSSYLGADSILFDGQSQQQQQPQQQKQQQQQQRGGRGRGRRGQYGGGYSVTDVCLKWNYSVCDFPQCVKYHVCEVCRGSHRAKECGGGPPPSPSQRGGYSQGPSYGPPHGYGPPQGAPPASGQQGVRN